MVIVGNTSGLCKNGKYFYPLEVLDAVSRQSIDFLSYSIDNYWHYAFNASNGVYCSSLSTDFSNPRSVLEKISIFLKGISPYIRLESLSWFMANFLKSILW